MEKTAIIASFIALFAFVGAVNAQTPAKLTPRQKIAAMRLAQMKKKQVKVLTGTVNTGVICSIPMPSTGFTMTTGLWSDNISGASNVLANVQRAIIATDKKEGCNTQYYTLYRRYSENKSALQKVVDDNIYYKLENEVLNLQNTYAHDTAVYSACLKGNKGTIHDKDCGYDPDIILHDKEDMLKTLTKPTK